MIISRRDTFKWLAAGPALLWSRAAWADDPRLMRRIELWRTFVRRNDTLVARYTSRRQSSMLVGTVQTSGSLGFVAPDQLVLRDDDLRGSTTRIAGLDVSIRPNDDALPVATIDDPRASAALAWLRDRLLRLFSPEAVERLNDDCSLRATPGRTPRIEILPLTGSMVRKTIRRLEVTLDPVGGAIAKLVIDEAQGDSLTLVLSDHRQGVAASELSGLGLSRPGGADEPRPH